MVNGLLITHHAWSNQEICSPFAVMLEVCEFEPIVERPLWWWHECVCVCGRWVVVVVVRGTGAQRLNFRRRTPTLQRGAHTTTAQYCFCAVQLNWHRGDPWKEGDRRPEGSTEHYNQSMCTELMINPLSALSPGGLGSSLCIKAPPSCWCCQ